MELEGAMHVRLPIREFEVLSKEAAECAGLRAAGSSAVVWRLRDFRLEFEKRLRFSAQADYVRSIDYEDGVAPAKTLYKLPVESSPRMQIKWQDFCWLDQALVLDTS